METAAAAGRIDHNASDSESASLPEVGSVRDKIGRFTDNSYAMMSGNSPDKGPRHGTLPPSRKTSHDPAGDMSQKPPIPRKPILLASTKPPDHTEPPFTKRTPSPSSPQKRPSFIKELVESHGGVQSPKTDHYSDNQPAPLSDNSRPRLPPRTGTYSSERSSSPLRAVSLQESPSHIAFKPELPPRQNTAPIFRTPTENQGILLVDNESPNRLLNESESSLLDEPSVMVEQPPNVVRTSSSASGRGTPARKVPPPPPRQRRAGPRPVSELEQTGRTTSYATPESARQTPRRPTNEDGPKNRISQKNEINRNEQIRYEAVWAANKGILIPGPNEAFGNMYPAGASEMILNLVVRDIWSRSCLPNDVLQRVWDLVDRQNVRLLTKDEFMVGMWLIDRKLEGRQLPVEVPDPVWNSMKHTPPVDLL